MGSSKQCRYFHVSGAISENKDLPTAIEQFTKNFEAENGVKITTYPVDGSIVKNASLGAILHLTFKYEKSGRSQTSRVILKIPSLAPLYHTQLKQSKMYERKVYFYEKLLPALYQWGQCEPVVPKLYAATQGYALVLEDLSVEGYRSDFETKFLDFDHSMVSLNALAKYHALSYKYFRSLKEDDPSKSLVGPYYPGSKTITGKYEFISFCSVVKSILSTSLYQKVLNLKDKIPDVSLPTKKHHDDRSMTVIIHGDFQARNIFYKYDSKGKVSEVKMIDWQAAEEASPVIDLIEFFVPNVDIKVVEAYETNLLDSYLATLNHQFTLISINRLYR